jgi:hypothetical protein
MGPDPIPLYTERPMTKCRSWAFILGLGSVVSIAACKGQIDGSASGNGGSGGHGGTGGAGTGGGAIGSGGAAGSGDAAAGSGGQAGSGTDGSDAAAGSDAAGGSTPPPDGAPSSCLTTASEFCDDFEGGAVDMQRWKLNKPSGSASITVDSVHAHGGKYAVHIKVVPNQQSTAMISESVTFPAATNSFYARMFVYFSPEIPTAASADFHTGFMFGTGQNDRGPTQIGMGMIGSAKQWLGYSIFFGNPKLEYGPWSKARMVANQWVCVELFEDGSNPDTEIRQIWIDDVEFTELRSDSAKSAGGNPNHRPPKFDGVSFGLWEYHPIPTLSDMWIDDIRVSSTKIGCSR